MEVPFLLSKVDLHSNATPCFEDSGAMQKQKQEQKKLPSKRQGVVLLALGKRSYFRNSNISH